MSFHEVEKPGKSATAIHSPEWESLKQEGSSHYKTGKVEPIDLYKSITPHSSLNAMEVKALTDNIKYSYRMLSRGITVSDLDKVIHYSRLAKCSFQEREQ